MLTERKSKWIDTLMLTMIFLNAATTGAVNFSAYSSVFSETFPSKIIFERINIYDSN